MTSVHQGYRPEIDGLRAIAVIPVVLYHFGVPGMSGGFVGVDIFFVISGFLIGGILWQEVHTTGHIRLGAFFLRRVRRLAPAYMAMAFVTLCAAWAILLPFDFREFGQELIAATVYLANVHFFMDSGYFDAGSDKKLLLHTWSLAVEEQFYLILPLLMLALARWTSGILTILVGAGIVSFAACLWMMQVSAPAAFYLFPFRAWELLAGVCLAIWAQRTGFDWRLPAWVSWIGIAAILVAVTTLKAGDHFPGIYAALPVLGTVLVLAGGQGDNPVNALLRSRPFLFFGLISYSLYLWHWPLITLYRYVFEAPTAVETAALFAGAIAISWLSLKVVEQPFRRGVLGARKLVVAYGIGAGCLLGAASGFAFSDGWPDRFPPSAQPFITATRDFNQDWSRCHVPQEGSFAGVETCPIGPEGAPRVLVWGDSHARAFKEGVDRAAHETGIPGLLIWRAGCPPLLGVAKRELVSTPSEDAACIADQDRIRDGLATTPSIDRLLLIGRWSYYASGTGIGADAHNRVILSPIPESNLIEQPQDTLFSDALAYTVDTLGDTLESVFVLRQLPEIPDYGADRAARAVVYGSADIEQIRDMFGTASRQELETRAKLGDAALARLDDVRIIDLWDALCDAVTCSALLQETPVYFDNNHLTNAGALALRHHFKPVFQ